MRGRAGKGGGAAMRGALATKARASPMHSSPVQRAPARTSTVDAVAARGRPQGLLYSAGPAFGLGAGVKRQTPALGTGASPSTTGSARADIQGAMQRSNVGASPMSASPTPIAPGRALRGRPIQAKLAVGPAGDAYE